MDLDEARDAVMAALGRPGAEPRRFLSAAEIKDDPVLGGVPPEVMNDAVDSLEAAGRVIVMRATTDRDDLTSYGFSTVTLSG